MHNGISQIICRFLDFNLDELWKSLSKYAIKLIYISIQS